ncbi:MAG: toprim domain-containing protein [Balneolaceae bacterium]
MKESSYTLLIIESPVLAGIIQNLIPEPVYVIATGGFCWQPVYNSEKNQLSARAVPKKSELRKELKEQAQWAGEVIIATDQDPSGDFIAWSVLRFLKTEKIKRARLQNISRNGIRKMLDNASVQDESRLTARLRNRFLIRHEWSRASLPLTMQLAGLAAVSGSSGTFQTFKDEHGNLFKSTKTFQCTSEEQIEVHSVDCEKTYIQQKPLSAFDVIFELSKNTSTASFDESNKLLQKLFQTLLPSSERSLISYPRTSEQAFYSETWETLKNQYMNIGPLNDLRPDFIQQMAAPDIPHESIYPLDLALTPEQIRGEFPKKISSLYQIIYRNTLDALKMPAAVEKAYQADSLSSQPDTRFYASGSASDKEPLSLRPVLTVADFGHALNRLGVQKPSSFGKNLDFWINEKWISIHCGIVKPGKRLAPYLSSGEIYRKKLTVLRQAANFCDLTPETVRSILTSNDHD